MVLDFIVAIAILSGVVYTSFTLGWYSVLRWITDKAPEAVPYIEKAFRDHGMLKPGR